MTSCVEHAFIHRFHTICSTTSKQLCGTTTISSLLHGRTHRVKQQQHAPRMLSVQYRLCRTAFLNTLPEYYTKRLWCEVSYLSHEHVISERWK